MFHNYLMVIKYADGRIAYNGFYYEGLTVMIVGAYGSHEKLGLKTIYVRR